MAWGDYKISFSGGLASGASAIVAHETNLNYEMIFADTTIESEHLYTFCGEVENALQRKITYLKDGRDPWQVFVDVRFIGNSRTAHCSDILKTQQVKAYLDKTSHISSPLILGMYRDEEDRLERAKVKWWPRPVRSLLIENSIYPGDALELITKYGLKRSKSYDLGFPHDNCGGMCVRAGQGQFARLLDLRPEHYALQESRNEYAREQIGATAGGFIRVTRDYETEYLHMKEFRERVQSGELKPARYEMGGCGCFVD